jgi:hypothetical protein
VLADSCALSGGQAGSILQWICQQALDFRGIFSWAARSCRKGTETRSGAASGNPSMLPSLSASWNHRQCSATRREFPKDPWFRQLNAWEQEAPLAIFCGRQKPKMFNFSQSIRFPKDVFWNPRCDILLPERGASLYTGFDSWRQQE